VAGAEWYSVDSLGLTTDCAGCSPTRVVVTVDVHGKHLRARARRWVGAITLDLVGGEWRLARMALHEEAAQYQSRPN
jgi:hypothetical protein